MQTESTNNKLDLSSPAFIADPYPTYKKLHETGAPYWFPFDSKRSGGMWLIAGYDDANKVLRENRHTTNNITPHLAKSHASPLENTILQSDPPEHTRRRKIISEYFTLKKLQTLRPHIETVVADRIKTLEANDGMDFMAEFANKIPFFLSAESIGIPREDHEMFFDWSRQLTSGLDDVTNDEASLQQRNDATLAMKAYFSDWLHESHEPAEGSITAGLLSQYRTTGNLDKTELLSMLMLLLVAGHENITSSLGNGLLELINHPEQKTLLANNPSHMSSAIEEIFRYHSPVQRASLRIATDEFEAGKHTYRRGDLLSVMIGAANRDPAQFRDPDNFDITRKANKHIAFGAGPHACIGAALARMQTGIVFSRLLEKWPDIRLADEPLQWRQSTIFRGLQSLPVLF